MSCASLTVKAVSWTASSARRGADAAGAVWALSPAVVRVRTAARRRRVFMVRGRSLFPLAALWRKRIPGA